MKHRNLNKFQLYLLMLLASISMSWTHAASPSNGSYQQWKSEQQAKDQQLNSAAESRIAGNRAAASASQNHYLSKPALAPSASSDKIRLNSADAAQFQQLSGIGQKKAEAIVEYRSKNGKFKNIEDIQAVKGIGPVIYAKNKDRLAL